MELLKTLRKSLSLLDRRAKRKFILAMVVQSSLGLLDVCGVFLSGAIATIASTSFFHLPNPALITHVLEFLHMSKQSPANTMLFLTFFALAFFIAKTILALMFARRTFQYLAGQQSRISTQLVSRVLSSDYIWLRNQDPHALSQTLVRGVSAATVNELGNVLLLTAELVLVLLFLTFLIVVKPLIAIFMMVYLFLVLYGLNVIVGRRITGFHNNLTVLDLQAQMGLFNALKLFREMRVLQRAKWFEESSKRIVAKQAENFADDAWIQQMPKYVLEVALLIGAALLLVAGRYSANSEQLIPILAVYLAGTARIFPSLLRIQSSLFSLRSHSALTTNAHTLFEVLQINGKVHFVLGVDSVAEHKYMSNRSTQTVDGFGNNELRVDVSNLSFTYPDSKKNVLNGVSFSIRSGERVAVVGPSGAGKSTLCDLFLGLLQPTEGTLKIGQVPAAQWIIEHTGKVSYLPQETTLVSGSVLENICIGLDLSDIDLKKVGLAVERAQLTQLIRELPQGWNTDIGISGAKLSGGQKQRIGIARALYSDPAILIMDEATSALDAETEHEVMSVLEALGDRVTIIFIAHRLSSIRNFPRIIYLEDGRILGDGSFSQLRFDVPRFGKQVSLLGL